MTFFKVPFSFILLLSLNLLVTLVSTKRSGSTSSISSNHDVNHDNLLQPKIEHTSSNPIETDLKLGNGGINKRKRPIEHHLASTATSKAPKREISPFNDATTLSLGRTNKLPLPSSSSSSASELSRTVLHAKYHIKKVPVNFENDHSHPVQVKIGPSKGISHAERNRKSPSQETINKFTSNELKRQILSKPKSQTQIDLSKIHHPTNSRRSKSPSSGNKDDNKGLSLSLTLRKRGIENGQETTLGNGQSHPTIPPNHVLSLAARPQTGIAQVRTGGPIRNNNHGLMVQVNHPYNRMAQISQQQAVSPYGATRLMGTNVHVINRQDPQQLQNVLHHIRTAQIQDGQLTHNSGIPIQVGQRVQEHQSAGTPVGRGGGPHFLTQPPHLVNSPHHSQSSTEHLVPVQQHQNQQQIRIEHTLPSPKPVGPTQDLLGKVGQGSPPRQSYIRQSAQHQHNSEHSQPNLNLSLGSGPHLRSFRQSSPRSKLDLSLA